jgi:polysaccharide export outer membrane protein
LISCFAASSYEQAFSQRHDSLAENQRPSQFGNNNISADTAKVDRKGVIPTAADPAPYVIGPADVLTVRVWREPDFSGEALPVRPDGKISMALLDDVQAAGLTPMQLAAEIKASLKRYVSDPQVTVVVDAINSKRIYLIGQVVRPGTYPLLPQMTVLQAISSAGGFPEYANPKKTYVPRGSKKLPFNYKEALKGERLDRQILLEPGDTIVVP